MMRVLMRERVGKSGGSTAGIADVHKPRTLAKLHGLENADDLEQCLQARPPWAIPAYGRRHVLRGSSRANTGGRLRNQRHSMHKACGNGAEHLKSS